MADYQTFEKLNCSAHQNSGLATSDISICIPRCYKIYWSIKLKDLSVSRRITSWRLIGRFDAFCSTGRGLESRSSRHVGTLGKSLTHSCLWRFDVKLRHSIRAVSVALLSSSGLEYTL